MALMNVLRFPDPRLRKKAKAVEKVDARVRQIVSDMIETMCAEQGIGLAATQVDIHEQILITDVGRKREDPWADNPLCLINPVITASEGEIRYEEGCLSVPGYNAMITRPEKISVEAIDLEGKGITLEADGLLSICIQHEIDHLQGKLFVDYLSPFKRQRIMDKMSKMKRKEAKQSLSRATI